MNANIRSKPEKKEIPSTEIALIENKPYPQPSVDHLLDPRILTSMQTTSNEVVKAAILVRGEVTAVCGFQWHPSSPLGYKPVCEVCKSIIDNI
jgi:hypothetical protein